jgi:hypothetical protein
LNGQGHDGRSLPGQGIAGSAAGQRRDAERQTTLQITQDAHQELDGVSPLGVDIDAGMTTAQPVQIDSPARAFGRQRFCLPIPANVDVQSSRAAEVKLAPFFGIEVEQQAALQYAAGQTARAAHAGFLVDGQQGFDRPMDQIPGLQNSKDQRHPDAVVGAKGSVLSDQPAIASNRPDRITAKVVL